MSATPFANVFRRRTGAAVAPRREIQSGTETQWECIGDYTFPGEFPADVRMIEMMLAARAYGLSILASAIAAHRAAKSPETLAALDDALANALSIDRQIRLAKSFVDYLSLARDVSEECKGRGVWLHVLSRRATKLLGRLFK
ncbi:hypothetical protein [Burkholderia vietnamiensis]|uniref:hypothetical protein n=1 Tax=Burkholderia vietnamiensis TaxID=60552 RepID=UPI00158CC597|nr:hypothetical protein [Burkholderia vietnamiensis]